ncbi:tRNA-intron lyase [[Eubacterium] cellulosolvens]
MNEPLVEVEALKDSRLVIWSPENGRNLYRNGFFGKPLGIPKPKDDFDAPLILDPIEGVYLMEKGIIKIVSGPKLEKVEYEELLAKARQTLDRFDQKYLVYKDLREKGFVVTPGIKYGCDFAIYKHGPGIDHAPFIIQVKDIKDELNASDIVKAGRLATTVRKIFILAVVNHESPRYLGFRWWKP